MGSNGRARKYHRIRKHFQLRQPRLRWPAAASVSHGVIAAIHSWPDEVVKASVAANKGAGVAIVSGRICFDARHAGSPASQPRSGRALNEVQ